MDFSDNESKYLRAKERVTEIKKFYTGLIYYVVIIIFLAGLNYYIDQWSYPWFLWAAFGWGLGIVFQAIKTFGLNPFFSKKWEERKIKEFMDDDHKRQRWE